MDIYAEITKKQLADYESGKWSMPDFPGVEINNRPGSRGFFFECDNEYAFDAVVEFAFVIGFITKICD